MINGVLKMVKIVVVTIILLCSMFISKQDEKVNSLQEQVKEKDMELVRQRELVKQLNNEIIVYQDLEQLKEELGKYQKGLKN
mgnify:CR=1 FL=1